MVRTRIATLLLLISALATPAIAQDGYGYEIGAFGGWADWRERQYEIGFPQAVPPIPVSFDYNDEILAGIRFNFLSRGLWAGEFSYSYQQNTSTIIFDSTTPLHLDGGVHHFFYNQIFYPRKYETTGIKPYLAGGIGLAGYTISLASISRAGEAGLPGMNKTDNRFAFNYGGGIKFEPTRSFGVRLDFRHNFSEVPTYGLPKQSNFPNQPVLPFDSKLQAFEMSVGVYYHTVR